MQEAMQLPPRSRATAIGRGLVWLLALVVVLLGALLGAACRSKSGEDGVAVADANGSAVGPSVPTPSAPTPSTSGGSAPQATSGRTVDVQMVGDASGYRFVPATVTIKVGDSVRWTNVSGGPHDVSFWADSVPSGGASALQAAMTQTMSPLVGPLLTAPTATYTISFAGAPPGTYKYYCMPHLALGMKGTIVVQQ